MAGKNLPGIIDTAMAGVYEENLQYAVDILESRGMVGVIEPISPDAVPDYFMNSFDNGMWRVSLSKSKLLVLCLNNQILYPLAVRIIKKLNSKSLRLQLDVFHLQLLKGSLTHHIKELLPYTGTIHTAYSIIG